MESETVTNAYRLLFAILKAFSAHNCQFLSFHITEDSSFDETFDASRRYPFPPQYTFDCLRTVVQMAFDGICQPNIIPLLLNASNSLAELSLHHSTVVQQQTWTIVHEQPFLKHVTLENCSTNYLDLILIIGSNSISRLEILDGMLGNDKAIPETLPSLEDLVISGQNYDFESSMFAQLFMAAARLKNLELPQECNLPNLVRNAPHPCDTIQNLKIEWTAGPSSFSMTSYHRALHSLSNLVSITLKAPCSQQDNTLQDFITAIPHSIANITIEWRGYFDDCCPMIQHVAGRLSNFPNLATIRFKAGYLLPLLSWDLGNFEDDFALREAKANAKAISFMESCHIPRTMDSILLIADKQIWQNQRLQSLLSGMAVRD